MQKLIKLSSVRDARLRAKGSDTKGRGAFQTLMVFTLTAQGAETLVQVKSDLSLSGSVAQHARGAGLVKEMAQQLSGRFAKNLAGLIAAGNSRDPTGAELPETRLPAPQAASAVSGLALLFAAIRALLRRWFGGRS